MALSGESEANAGTKRGRPHRGKPTRAKTVETTEPGLTVPLALRVLWTALENVSTRSSLLERQRPKLEALLPILKAHAMPNAVAGSLHREIETMLAISCALQLEWHFTTATLVKASTEAPTAKSRRSRSGARTDDKDDGADVHQALNDARCILGESLKWASSLLTQPSQPDGDGGPSGAQSSAAAQALAPHVLGEANVENSPGEARPKARARIAPRTEGDFAAAVSEPRGLCVRALLCAWAAEAGAIGIFDMQLANEVVGFVSRALTLARAASTSEAAAVDQLLPHACKLTVQLFELASCDSNGLGTEDGGAGTEFGKLGSSLLLSILALSSSTPEVARGLRPLLMEVLLLQQQQSGVQSGDQSHVSELVRRLLQYVVNATPPQAQLPAGPGGGVAALSLPPNPAEVLEVLLLRSSGCTAEILPCAQQLLRASHASPATALQCVRLILACEVLHRPSQPGLGSLRRFLQGLSLEPAPSYDEKAAAASPTVMLEHAVQMLVTALA